MSDAELAVLLVRRAYEAQFGTPLPVPTPRAPASPAESAPAPQHSASDGAANRRKQASGTAPSTDDFPWQHAGN